MINNSIKKSALLILLFVLFLFTGCVNKNEQNNEYTLSYSVIGNGQINCQYESNTKLKEGTYVYLLSIPNTDEELISWTVNGVENGKDSGIVIQLNSDYKVVATFSTNKKTTDESTSDNDYIYANISEWNEVSIVIKTTETKTYKMDKNNNDIYYFNLSENSVSKDKIKTVIFKSGNKSTEEYNYDSLLNVYNSTGYDRKGIMRGAFSNKVSDVMKLSVLEMNDLHGYIMQSSEGKAGISNASYIINQVRNEDDIDNVVLVANGDMFQGTALSNLSHGLSVVNCMNSMQFDFMGIGNHEFDWGLEYIIQYFDGNKENGEANFPLINGNIKLNSSNELLTDENIITSYMLEKNGIKIGVISMIDDLSSSILYSKVKDYTFLGVTLAEAQAIDLKNKGADIIVANVHGSNDNYNKQLANLNYNGEWLIDCVINGHTHSNDTQVIEREGQDLPIVQGGSYCYYVGQIDLYVDLTTKEVLSCDVYTNSIYEANTNYDEEIQLIVDQEYEKVKNDLTEVYCVSTASISSKNVYKDWVANVMRAATGSICGVSNTGGLRSTGNITNGTEIGLENMYLINPFDNELVIVEVSGKKIYEFLSRNRSVYYTLSDGYSLDSLKNDNNLYKVAVIDYVYYWDSFPKGTNDIFTGLVLRDCMIADLRLRETFNPSVDSEAKIGNLLTK